MSEGDYADQFRAGWSRTSQRFQEYIDQTKKISAVLDERIEHLRRINQSEGGLVEWNGYDPRIVAQALEDLESELTRWLSVASDMLSLAADTQRHAKEFVDRALHNAAIVLDRAQDDQDDIAKAEETVASNIVKTLKRRKYSKRNITSMPNSISAVKYHLKKMGDGTRKALAWLARAEARIKKRFKNYNAPKALYEALNGISSAELRLRNCQNDKERSNRSGEAAAVSRARAEVASARQRTIAAEQEVAAAKEEVERARARVACCKRAVTFANEAVNLAQESVSAATQSINSSERSLEFAYAAERLVLVAEKNMLVEMELAENMMSETKSAQNLTDNAAIHLRNADTAEDISQIYSTSVRKELEHRINMLYELNKPSLDNSNGASQQTLHPSINPAKRKGSNFENHVRDNVFGSVAKRLTRHLEDNPERLAMTKDYRILDAYWKEDGLYGRLKRVMKRKHR